jgi:hypothetical protein
LSVVEASGTPDGWQTALELSPLSDRTLTVANLSYLVGDTAVAQWYNAGEFGDGNLGNNDVNSAFLSSVGVRTPPAFTDAFDAMDAFPEDTVATVGGDGQIRFLDWQLTLRRSLRLAPANWRRSRAPGGARFAFAGALPASPLLPAASASAPTPGSNWFRPVKLWAGVVEQGHAGFEVQVPVYMEVAEGYDWAGGQIWPVVAPQRDSRDSAVPIDFVVNPDLGIPAPSPTPVFGLSPNNVVYVWHSGALAPPLVGSNLLGKFVFQLPPSAVSGDCYFVRFAVADGASSREQQLDAETVPGAVWVQSPALRPAEVISDEWRTNFFGSITASRAAADADPDHDSLSNRSEYLLNTDPLAPDWRASVRIAYGHAVVRWYGEAGKQYVVLRSSGLGPWEELGPAVAGQNGMQEFTDPGPVQETRFYRVRTSP